MTRWMSVLVIVFSGCLETEIPDLENLESTENPQPTEEGQLSVIIDSGGTEGGVEILESEQSPFIQIDDGSGYTNQDSYTINMSYPWAWQYRLSSDETCEIGAWSAMVDSVEQAVAEQNTKNVVFVQFRDPDYLESECIRMAVIHDNLPPEIVFHTNPPALVEVGADVSVGVSIEDAGIGLDTVTCEYNGAPIECIAAGSMDMQLIGQHEFSVTAMDKFGYSSTRSVQWESTHQTQLVSQAATVEGFNNKVDILFVIDNSGSMEFEQQNMAERVQNLIEKLHELDWQIGVITTDPYSQHWGDGRMLELEGMPGQYILDSSTSVEVAQQVLGQTLQREEYGHGKEQGIRTTYRALERALAGEEPHRNLIREDAALSVVLISDEDESSDNFKNMPINLFNLVKDSWQEEKHFTFHSIITIPGDEACINGHGARYGHRYKEMSELTGAGENGLSVIGTVCAQDYTEQLAGIGEAVGQLPRAIPIACAPVVDEIHPLAVLQNGQNYTGGFAVDGQNLVFDDFLEPGEYELQYHCPN